MKKTITVLQKIKGVQPISCITAYDYISAKLLDEAGIDLILTGDSLGMVVQGSENTLSVTVDEMIYHGKITRKGIKDAFFVVDMPFGSYVTVDAGIQNATRIAKETGADAVKLEGATPVCIEIVKKLRDHGILTVAHVGLQPQMVNVMGGYKAQGFNNFQQILDDAVNMEKAGAVMIVLEGVAPDCAAKITEKLSIPTIGIGSGINCDGQILVFHDMFGFNDFKAKFVKKYANAGDLIKQSTKEYIDDVMLKRFPAEEHTYKAPKK